MLPPVLGFGIGVEAVRSLKCAQIYGALLVWLGVSAVHLKFGGRYFLSPGRHFPRARPYRDLLRLQVHDFEVDVVGVPWDDDQVTELKPVVGS